MNFGLKFTILVSLKLASWVLILFGLGCASPNSGEFLKYNFNRMYFSNSGQDTLRDIGSSAVLKPDYESVFEQGKISMVFPEDTSLYYEFNSKQVVMVFGENGILIDTTDRKGETYRGTSFTSVDLAIEYYTQNKNFWLDIGYTETKFTEIIKGVNHNVYRFSWVDTSSLESLVRQYSYPVGDTNLSRFQAWQEFNGYKSYEQIDYTDFKLVAAEEIFAEAEKRKSNNKGEIKYRNWDEISSNIQVSYNGMLVDSLPLASGETIVLSDLAGGKKHVLLDFWYISCAPCIKAMPELQNLHNDFKNTNLLEVVSLNPYNYKVKENVEAFLDEKGYDFRSYFLEKSWADDRYIKSFPTYLLLNESGKVIHTEIGYSDSTFSALREIIEK